VESDNGRDDSRDSGAGNKSLGPCGDPTVVVHPLVVFVPVGMVVALLLHVAAGAAVEVVVRPVGGSPRALDQRRAQFARRTTANPH
jgi:hypothetical protein